MGLNPNSPVHEPNGNTVTLREYIEAIMSERDRALTAAFTAQQSALNLATRNLELRLEKLNELRQEVTQDRASYLTRDRAEATEEAMDARISALESFRGKALGFGALVSVLSAVGGALVVKAIGG
jgi:hypothetical protein